MDWATETEACLVDIPDIHIIKKKKEGMPQL